MIFSTLDEKMNWCWRKNDRILLKQSKSIMLTFIHPIIIVLAFVHINDICVLQNISPNDFWISDWKYIIDKFLIKRQS